MGEQIERAEAGLVQMVFGNWRLGPFKRKRAYSAKKEVSFREPGRRWPRSGADEQPN